MSLFPLYDEVVSKMDGTEKVLSRIHCNNINKLRVEHLENIYLLILHHYYNKTGMNRSDNLPYCAKTVTKGKGVQFKKLSQIPSNLQKIIFKYLEVISN